MVICTADLSVWKNLAESPTARREKDMVKLVPMEKLTEDVEFGLTRVRSAPRAASDNAAIGIQKERRPARIEPGNLRLEIIEDSDNVEWYHKGDGNITKERVKKNQQWSRFGKSQHGERDINVKIFSRSDQ